MQREPEIRRHPQVANLDEVAGHSTPGDAIASTMKQLGAATGGGVLGCTYYEAPPGRSGFPRHFHCVNEESLFVLEGEATLRLGSQAYAAAMGRAPDGAFRDWLVAHYRDRDPRMVRYGELLAVLRGEPALARPSEEWSWLIEASRAHLAR